MSRYCRTYVRLPTNGRTSIFLADADPVDDFVGTIVLDVAHPEHCEVVGNGCLLPFPSDALTVTDDAFRAYRDRLESDVPEVEARRPAMDVMACSIGASVQWPAAGEGRSADVEPFWGTPRITEHPFDGSAVVMFDGGTPLPPIINTPPREGQDPHEDVHLAAKAYDQIAAFLQPDGVVVDTCRGIECTIPQRE